MRTRHHNPLHLIAVAGLVMILVSAYFDATLSPFLVHIPGAAYAQGGSLSNVGSVAVDSAGHRLFVADYNHSRVLVYDLNSGTNQLDDEVPDAVLGQSDLEAAATGTSQALFNGPAMGIAFDPDNNLLFVGDDQNCRILVWDVTAITDGEDASYVLGAPDFDTPGTCAASASEFGLSDGVYNGFSLDTDGDRLFIADTRNDRVLIFDVSPSNLVSEASGLGTAIDAINVLGQELFTDSDPNSGAGSSTPGQDGFESPTSTAYDSDTGYLFVVDEVNQRVMIFDVNTIDDGEDAINELGQFDDGTPFNDQNTGLSASAWNNPEMASIDVAGRRLFVASRTQNRVLVFDITALSDGEPAVNVLGQEDDGDPFDSDAAGSDDDSFTAPSVSAFDPVSNYLYVPDTDNTRVMVFDILGISDGEPAVEILNTWTSDTAADNVLGQEDFTSNAQELTQDGVNDTNVVAFDETNKRLFVSDGGNHRILVYDLSGGISDGMNASYVLGQTDFSSGVEYAGDGPGSPNQNGFETVAGIAYSNDSNEWLFVSDSTSERVLIFDLSGGITNGMNASFVLGQANFTDFLPCSGQGGVAADCFESPRSLAFNPTENQLYVVDATNNRVLVFDFDHFGGGPTNNFAASYALGQPGGTSDSTSGTDYNAPGSFLSTPIGIAFDQTALLTGTLFVSDYLNNRVLAFTTPASASTDVPYFVLGQSSSSASSADAGDTGPNRYGLSGPFGLAAGNDKLYVSDNANNRVMVWDYGSVTDGEAAWDAIGQPDFSSLTPDLTQSKLSGPNGLAYGATDDILFVADQGNTRVMVFGDIVTAPAPTVDAHIADEVIGQTNAGVGDFTTQHINGFAGLRRAGYNNGLEIDDVHDRLFVSEYGRVLMFDLDASHNLVDQDADYVFGQSDFTTTAAGGVTRTTFAGAEGIAYDGTTDRLFVSDTTANRVLVFDASPANLASDGNGTDAINVLGQTDFTSNSGDTTQGKLFTFVGDVVMDEENQRLFVMDSNNSRVMVFDVSTITDGELAVNVLGKDNFTTSSCSIDQDCLTTPISAAYASASERLFVADNNGNRVMVFDVDPAVLIPDTPATDGPDAINVLGKDDFTTSDTTSDADGIARPSGIAYDPTGDRLIVYDPGGKRYVIYDVDPAVLIPDTPATDGPDAINVLGQDTITATGYGYGKKSFFPSSLGDRGFAFFDNSTGRFYAGESYKNEYRIFDLNAVTNGEEPVDYETSANDTGFGLGNLVNDVLVDANHNRLFVSDETNSRVLMFELDSEHQPLDYVADAVLGQTTFDSSFAGLSSISFWIPEGLAYEPTEDYLYVVDSLNARVLVFDVATIANGEPAFAVIGQSDFISRVQSTTQSGLTRPVGAVADDGGNRLFISDFTDNRVLIHDTSSLINGQDADVVLGQGNFTDAVPATTQTGMTNPYFLEYDSDGDRLFVADAGNKRILVFNTFGPTDGLPADFVLGQPDFTATDTGPDAVSPAGNLTGVAYSPANELLYGADYNGNRIMVWDVASITNGEDAIDLYGQTDFTESTAGTSDQALTNPTSVDFDDDSSTLFVSDFGNYRVLLFGSTIAPAPGGQTGIQPGQAPAATGFTPLRVVVNSDASSVDSRNAFVQIHAIFTDSFRGTIDVVLSNTADFYAFQTFRYMVSNASNDRATWPKTIAWDLCYGLSAGQTCNPGTKTVYARFYANIPAPTSTIPVTPVPSASTGPSVQVTRVPIPATCPSDCRQLGLYNPSEVNSDGRLAEDDSRVCIIVRQAGGLSCAVPNAETNYCYQCR